jgi:hypothetical protein
MSDYGTQKKEFARVQQLLFFPFKTKSIVGIDLLGFSSFCFFPSRKKIVGKNLLGF